MERIECISDEDFKEQFLTLLSDSAYPKLISSLNRDGSKVDLMTVNWSMTLAEEQAFVPILMTRCDLEVYFIGFCKNTKLTGYFPQKPIFC